MCFSPEIDEEFSKRLRRPPLSSNDFRKILSADTDFYNGSLVPADLGHTDVLRSIDDGPNDISGQHGNSAQRPILFARLH